METKQIGLTTLLAGLAAIVLVEVVVSLVDSAGSFSPLMILGAARAVEAVLIIGMVYLLGGGLSVIGLDGPVLLSGIKRGLIWSAGFGAASLLLFCVMSLAGLEPLKYIRGGMPAEGLAGYFLVGAVIGPVAEELMFRGLLYGFFRRWGVFSALVLSTLMFVSVHFAGGGAGLPQVVGGIVFAIAYEVEGSLMTPITIHILGNAAIFTLSLI